MLKYLKIFGAKSLKTINNTETTAIFAIMNFLIVMGL